MHVAPPEPNRLRCWTNLSARWHNESKRASHHHHHTMDAYILIGNANTRKSSVLRSLTDSVNRSVRDIQLQDNRHAVRFYARAGTLQVTRTTPDNFIQ